MFFTKLFKPPVDYSAELSKARKMILEAEALLVGVGSGLSASGGMDYNNHRLVKKILPDYHRMGYKKLPELQEMYANIMNENAKAYWGYWARVIKYIRYEAEVGNGYKDLNRLIRNKNYFIYTTNQDGQLEKAGFDMARIMRAHGDYEKLQCKTPCCDRVYDVESLLDPMIKTLGGNLEIEANKIPRCPHCGDYLIPNIKINAQYVDTMKQQKETYLKFIEEYRTKKMVLIELGVGKENEISQIFKGLMEDMKEAELIRINLEKKPDLIKWQGRCIEIEGDLNPMIAELASGVVSL